MPDNGQQTSNDNQPNGSQWDVVSVQDADASPAPQANVPQSPANVSQSTQSTASAPTTNDNQWQVTGVSDVPPDYNSKLKPHEQEFLKRNPDYKYIPYDPKFPHRPEG